MKKLLFFVGIGFIPLICGWKLFLISFVAVALIYAILAATTTMFYRNKEVTELSHLERNVLYGRATIGDRFLLFFGNILASYAALPVYILAGLITLITWLFL